MKLKYKYQRFQADAARSVTDIFKGQPYKEGAEHIIDQGKSGKIFTEIGYGNQPLMLDTQTLTDNVRQIQQQWDLKPIDHLQGSVDAPLFTIEMETGTGKTYTYIKTMYELNRMYGWSKFIVIVPSIAIRECVAKSFETMQEHFAAEYGRRYQYFVYNSKQLSKIDGFAQDNGLHVMIINTQAFNTSLNEDKSKGEGRSGDSAARIIFSKRDEFGSRRPIDILAKTRPIIIIDEPQSVLGANKANATRKGIEKFTPLFSLLYSATHRKEDIYNMVYRLDAMDAYNQHLVKKIEVKAITQVGSTATNGFVYLEEIVLSKGNPQARLSFDTKTATGVKQTTRLVSEGFNLYKQSGGLTEYADNFVVERIDGSARTVRLLNGMVLNEGEAVGKVNEDALRRLQIRETILTHLERERALFAKGIKVLSLFFIDHVENYRQYGKDGTSNGKFATMFEEEYVNVVQELQPTFTDEAYLRYLKKWSVEKIHNGYFSRDKKGNLVNPKIGRGEEGSNDESAYDLIMKDKERLLSFDEPVRFIFSHSALKEGWDNPNVFQICTLKDTSNEIKKRQEVGRGMRLCVNKDGERQDSDVLIDGVFDTNVLTVIASESYDHFAKALQADIASNIVSRHMVIMPTLFVDVVWTDSKNVSHTVSQSEGLKIYEQLILNRYVEGGKLTEKFWSDKKAETFTIGDELNEMKDHVLRQLDKVFNPDSIKIENARKTKQQEFRKDVFYKKEFQELWKRINVKTYYKVDFETEELISKAVKAIDEHLSVTQIRVVVQSGTLDKIPDKEALETGMAITQGKTRTVKVNEAVNGSVKYDLIGQLVERTGLTRRTIVAILKGIRPATFLQFKMNPEEFIIKTGNIINDEKAMAVVQKIAYERTSQTYNTDIFTENMLRGKIGVNAIESAKSLYDLIVVDSEGVEKKFAESLETENNVMVYTKLPRGFYISTPMGHYNPDWAVCFREGTVKHIYFIAETKGNEWQRSQLRGAEDCKLECAARHFEAISQSGSVVYGVAKDYKTLYDKVMK